MFDKDRYVTKGAREKLPVLLEVLLWDLVELARGETDLDYLQVFELSPLGKKLEGRSIQRIRHFQEQPPYEREMLVSVEQPVREKIYIIDSGEYSTLLLPREY